MTASRGTRRLALVLAMATLALGAATLHLAQSLQAERGRNTARAIQPAESPAGTPTNLPQIAPVAPSPAADPPPATTQTAARSAAGPDETERATLQQRLDELGNPAIRASRATDLKAALAPAMAELMQAASLQPHEAEQLLDFLAESTLLNQQDTTQCRLTPGCDPRTRDPSERRRQMQELERAVGPDVVRRLEGAEARQRIASFSSGLPAGQELSDPAAAELASALAEVWRRELEGADAAGTPGQLLYERGASVLTAAQLAAFRSRIPSLLERD